jgi:hypothetical protein
MANARESAAVESMNAFVGSSHALSGDGVAEAAMSIGASIPELWAVIGVETSGCGFLADRRPEILFERHKFHQLTGGRFDDGDISAPQPGGYGAAGAFQYDRLHRAMACDRVAALRSTSWGLGQILGMNCGMVGFRDVEAFVDAMCESEDAQLTAVSAFIRGAGLAGALRTHDWSSFARGYNGANYARNQYDVRLRGEHQKYATGLLPDLHVRAIQLYLRYQGFKPGPVDGFYGSLTRSALVEYQRRTGLPATGEIDEATLSSLAPPPR